MIHNTLKKITMVAMLAIFTFSGAVNAQKSYVVGQVTDAESGEAMPFVNVALMRPADTVFMRGATTNDQGFFAIAATYCKPRSWATSLTTNFLRSTNRRCN